MKKNQTLFGLCWGVSIALLANSCGIPQIIVLEPPLLVSPPPSLTNEITVAHSPENNVDDFLGYELFYKFYDPDTSASGFSTDRVAIENASPGTALSVIAQREYNRVHAATDTNQIPVVQVSAAQRSQAFELLISFPSNTGASPPAIVTSDSSPAISQELLRDISVVVAVDEGFSAEDIDLVDNDVPELVTAPDDSIIDMGLVVISYGVDFTNGTFAQVVSQPLVIPELLEIFFE